MAVSARFSLIHESLTAVGPLVGAEAKEVHQHRHEALETVQLGADVRRQAQLVEKLKAGQQDLEERR